METVAPGHQVFRSLPRLSVARAWHVTLRVKPFATAVAAVAVAVTAAPVPAVPVLTVAATALTITAVRAVMVWMAAAQVVAGLGMPILQKIINLADVAALAS